MTVNPPHVTRLARFSLTTANAARAAAFYEAAFGCRRLTTESPCGADFERLTGVKGGADRITLGLGGEVIELVQFQSAGRPYPVGSSAADLVFQHLAIVVPDMANAFRRISMVAGWKAISTDGPQRLPPSSGGVTAFKFRDPEGHPLELLAFPEGARSRWRGPAARGETCLGIDHSAISVSSSAASIAFYKGFGLDVSSSSFNHGSEQEKLDDVRGAEVEVTALAPWHANPHLELLCYHSFHRDPATARRSNDIASTRLFFETDPQSNADGARAAPRAVRDPDGHVFLIVASSPKWPHEA